MQVRQRSEREAALKRFLKKRFVRKTAALAVLLAAGLSVSLRGAEGRSMPERLTGYAEVPETEGLPDGSADGPETEKLPGGSADSPEAEKLPGGSPDSPEAERLSGGRADGQDASGAGTWPAAAGGSPDAGAEGFHEDPVEESSGGPVVYVCGAVRVPDVYTCAEGSRVADAVELAGGLTEDAAPWLLNLADPLFDGMKIYVPRTDEAGAYPGFMGPGDRTAGRQASSAGNAGAAGSAGAAGNARAKAAGGPDSGTVDINRATMEELVTLPGIGETRAGSIIRYREAHGGFRTPEDIMKVPGIKEKAYEKLKEKIRVE